MTRYRKKPVEVEAWQVGSDEPMPEWVSASYVGDGLGSIYQYILLNTEIGEMRVPFGFYLVRKSDGGVRAMSPEIFAQTYEVVE